MKLYMTLEDDGGLKVERVIRVDREMIDEHTNITIQSMLEELETINEAKRLVNNDKAIS